MGEGCTRNNVYMFPRTATAADSVRYLSFQPLPLSFPLPLLTQSLLSSFSSYVFYSRTHPQHTHPRTHTVSLHPSTQAVSLHPRTQTDICAEVHHLVITLILLIFLVLLE